MEEFVRRAVSAGFRVGRGVELTVGGLVRLAQVVGDPICWEELADVTVAFVECLGLVGLRVLVAD